MQLENHLKRKMALIKKKKKKKKKREKKRVLVRIFPGSCLGHGFPKVIYATCWPIICHRDSIPVPPHRYRRLAVGWMEGGT